MTRYTLGLLALVAASVACSTPGAPPAFPEDQAIGVFALDPNSPVIVRSSTPSDPDYAGATAPTVWQDAKGYHAAYLAIDASGGTSILGADSPDGLRWTKGGSALVASTPGLGRPGGAGRRRRGHALLRPGER